jgi:hypothetical protein
MDQHRSGQLTAVTWAVLDTLNATNGKYSETKAESGEAIIALRLECERHR